MWLFVVDLIKITQWLLKETPVPLAPRSEGEELGAITPPMHNHLHSHSQPPLHNQPSLHPREPNQPPLHSQSSLHLREPNQPPLHSQSSLHLREPNQPPLHSQSFLQPPEPNQPPLHSQSFLQPPEPNQPPLHSQSFLQPPEPNQPPLHSQLPPEPVGAPPSAAPVTPPMQRGGAGGGKSPSSHLQWAQLPQTYGMHHFHPFPPCCLAYSTFRFQFFLDLSDVVLSYYLQIGCRSNFHYAARPAAKVAQPASTEKTTATTATAKGGGKGRDGQSDIDGCFQPVTIWSSWKWPIVAHGSRTSSMGSTYPSCRRLHQVFQLWLGTSVQWVLFKVLYNWIGFW